MVRIALDIDEVLMEGQVDYFMDYLCDIEGLRVNRKKFYATHNWEAATGVPDGPELSEMFRRFCLSGRAKSAHPIPGAVQGMRQLATISTENHLVTARNQESMPQILEGITSHFEGVAFSGVWPCAGASKASTINQVEADLFMDDSVKEIERVLEGSSKVRYVFQFPSRFGGAVQSQDPRLYRLKACDYLPHAKTSEERQVLHKEAWEEFVKFVFSLAL